MQDIIVEKLTNTPTQKRKIELVERKGLGHPDTLCDGIAEAISRQLCQYYQNEIGTILHHNTDKIQLSGGQTQPEFKAGKIIKPIHILLSGQATTQADDTRIPVKQIATKAAKQYLKKTLPYLDVHKGVEIECRINPGSTNLQDVYKRSKKIPLANDTSLGVGYAPMTTLEKIVLNTENYINSPEYKKKRPEIGQDIKVMGYRNENKIRITVAAATLSHLIESVQHYLNLKEQLKQDVTRYLKKQTSQDLEVFVNTADKPANGKDGCYLTVTGTSGEMGDSGAVGRGNKANGLITPYRPMTMEAAAGKNPVSHVGKIYNILAFKTAGRIINEIPDIEEARVKILSQIGEPINQPQITNIELITDNYQKAQKQAKQIIKNELNNITNITEQILMNKFNIY